MACMSSNEEKSLLDLFDEGFALFQSVSNCDEPTNSVCIQSKIKQAMRILEDATRLTSMAGIFSSNESVEEVSTENLRLFLLPALLGTLALKLTVSNRSQVVETSDVYFRDFLQRCNDYGICDIKVPPPVDLDPEEVEKSMNSVRSGFDLAGAARQRASKIQRYKEEKALEEELKSLVKVIQLPDVDDEIKREYYTKLVKSYASKAEEEIDCLQSEKRIIVHMKNQAKKEEAAGMRPPSAEESRRATNRAKYPPQPKPLMPVIITKDEVQKAVFGAGYPSLPTMTVQEFYDKRVRDGIFPDPKKASTNPYSLQNLAHQGEARNLEEKEEAEKERKLETDDDEYLRREREKDEYKDTHKRGWGNRYNRS